MVSPCRPRHVRPRLPHRRAASCPAHAADSARPAKGADEQEAAGKTVSLMTAELLPLAVPEVRRLLFALVWQPPPLAAHFLHWSAWRRRHQAHAKRAHILRRQRLM